MLGLSRLKDMAAVRWERCRAEHVGRKLIQVDLRAWSLTQGPAGEFVRV